MAFGGIALALSLISFVLGTAPFTPATFLSVVALPLAVFSYFLGARRLAMLTIYWITASFLVVPVSETLQFRVDFLLVILGIGGLVLTAILYVTHRSTISTT
jgi:hypothetical protein